MVRAEADDAITLHLGFRAAGSFHDLQDRGTILSFLLACNLIEEICDAGRVGFCFNAVISKVLSLFVSASFLIVPFFFKGKPHLLPPAVKI